MEDRIEFNGNIFKVITSQSNGVVTSDIIKISKKGEEEHIYTFNISSNDLQNIHKKIISIIFKLLQKKINPTYKDFEEYDNFKSNNTSNESKDSELIVANNDKFEKICQEIKHPSIYGCCLIKDRVLYSYISQNSIITKSEIESYIIKFINMINIFDKNIAKSNHLSSIIENWRQIIQSYDDYYIYCIKLDDKSLLITIIDASTPIGKIVNISNNYLEYIKKQNLI